MMGGSLPLLLWACERKREALFKWTLPWVFVKNALRHPKKKTHVALNRPEPWKLWEHYFERCRSRWKQLRVRGHSYAMPDALKNNSVSNESCCSMQVPVLPWTTEEIVIEFWASSGVWFMCKCVSFSPCVSVWIYMSSRWLQLNASKDTTASFLQSQMWSSFMTDSGLHWGTSQAPCGARAGACTLLWSLANSMS